MTDFNKKMAYEEYLSIKRLLEERPSISKHFLDVMGDIDNFKVATPKELEPYVLEFFAHYESIVKLINECASKEQIMSYEDALFNAFDEYEEKLTEILLA